MSLPGLSGRNGAYQRTSAFPLSVEKDHFSFVLPAGYPLTEKFQGATASLNCLACAAMNGGGNALPIISAIASLPCFTSNT